MNFRRHPCRLARVVDEDDSPVDDDHFCNADPLYSDPLYSSRLHPSVFTSRKFCANGRRYRRIFYRLVSSQADETVPSASRSRDASFASFKV